MLKKKSIGLNSEKSRALFPIKLSAVYSLINTIPNHAIMYKNNVKYSGDINRHITKYFLPNSKKPKPRITQKEKA